MFKSILEKFNVKEKAKNVAVGALAIVALLLLLAALSDVIPDYVYFFATVVKLSFFLISSNAIGKYILSKGN